MVLRLFHIINDLKCIRLDSGWINYSLPQFKHKFLCACVFFKVWMWSSSPVVVFSQGNVRIILKIQSEKVAKVMMSGLFIVTGTAHSN